MEKLVSDLQEGLSNMIKDMLWSAGLTKEIVSDEDGYYCVFNYSSSTYGFVLELLKMSSDGAGILQLETTNLEDQVIDMFLARIVGSILGKQKTKVVLNSIRDNDGFGTSFFWSF
jgi:hypothetical protein